MGKHRKSEQYQTIEIKDGEDLEVKDGTRDARTEAKDGAPLEIKDGGLTREPGHGGNFVPPRWSIGRRRR